MTDWPVIVCGIVLLPAVGAGAWLGSWLHDRDERRAATRLCSAMTHADPTGRGLVAVCTLTGPHDEHADATRYPATRWAA